MALFFRSLLLGFLLLGWSGDCHGAMTAYVDRGKTDFDNVLQLLNPYGTWSKIDGQWAYTPLDHGAPYTNGRWIYTEYGWYWQGALPHSWETEHYGYWKRGADKIWSWYPGPYWLPSIVEIRATSTHIGWRSAAVDDDGNFVEKPDVRYTKTDEWTFVTLEQFANPIAPDIIAKPEQAKRLLEDSTECRHIYVTYREIDRPGPHPADFVALCKDGKMFAPKTLEDQVVPPTSAIIPGLTKGLPKPVAPTNADPAFSNSSDSDAGFDPDEVADRRQVKYWVTMSLPTFWAKPPADAKPEEVYLYRPDCFQDEDGIARRIELWLNPSSRKSATQRLNEVLGSSGIPTVPSDAATNNIAGQPAIPAVPAAPEKSHDPFKSPFEDPYHGDTGSSHAPNASSKSTSSAPATNAPSGLAPATNAAPAGK